MCPISRPNSFVRWVQEHAIPLNTVEAGNGFHDMKAISDLVGNARIIALGEATHGTREFFRLKHRMIEFLARESPLTVFAIEANMPEADRLNGFVLNGQGDPKKLIKGMHFWTWDTQEVLEMILWMRDFNLGQKGHIEFTGFDMQTPILSMKIVREFVEQHDRAYLDSLNDAYLDLERVIDSRDAPFAVTIAKFPTRVVSCKHIRYSGYIRTKGITKGYAGLWYRVSDDCGEVLAFDNMRSQGPTGNTPWTHYEMSLYVPFTAGDIKFGVLHPGNGTAWFDFLRIEMNGTTFFDGRFNEHDFDPAFRDGLRPRDDAYEVALDATVTRSGQKSLRIRSVRTQPLSTGDRGDIQQANATQIEEIENMCKQVLDRLEDRRPNLLQTSDVDGTNWAVQNARLVLQYAELEADHRSRDESMAQNVKWIADRSPTAKIIVWAHNGHIAYADCTGFMPMGAHLRKIFGSDVVNFGFAFNEGSFRAIEEGSGLLKEFALMSASRDSLDRTLAAARIPLFALDLRRAPFEGPVAQWLSKPHPSRSIGAVYSDSLASSLWMTTPVRDVFDVVLFVRKTTPTRANGLDHI